MNNIGIAKIKISNFLHLYNVEIPIIDNVKILIGENGLGKTQILNIFYCLLSRKFEKLVSYTFDEIEILFNDNFTYKINKIDLQASLFTESHPIISEVINKIGVERFVRLREDIF